VVGCIHVDMMMSRYSNLGSGPPSLPRCASRGLPCKGGRGSVWFPEGLAFRVVDVPQLFVAEAHADGMRGHPLQLDLQLLIVGTLVAKGSALAQL
jgi:hypothetical protein